MDTTTSNAPRRDENIGHIRKFALTTALCLMGDSMLYIALPMYYAQAGLNSLWEVGIVLAANRIVRIPLNPLIGRLYDRISERTGVLIAVLLAIATTFSYGFLPSLAWWILARCCWGLAWVLLRLGSLFCILRLSTQETRGRYTGTYNGLYRLGSLVGMLAGGLLSDLVGLQVCAVVLGIGSTIALVPTLLWFPKGKGGQPREHGPTLRQALPLLKADGKALVTVLSGGMMALLVQGVVAATLSRLIGVHVPGGLTLWGWVAGAATLAGLFQALRWTFEPALAPRVGRLADMRYGWKRIYQWSYGFGGLVFFALTLSLPLPIWFALILALQVSAMAMTTMSDTGVSDVASHGMGNSLLIVYAVAVDLGSALGPPLAFALDDRWGVDSGYLASAMCCFVLYFVWQRMARSG
ncbi:MAG: MFS transporter [Desulfovibrio sp.]|jgi:MFS family permease|nr:MFS transporter [Desulfovibrio sp.]